MTEQSYKWAIIELMGHSKIAGRYLEHGQMHRIDVPETDPEAGPDEFKFTRLYSQAAIYSITFVDEQAARLAARSLDTPAIQIYEVSREIRRLAAPVQGMFEFDEPDETEPDYDE